MIIRQTAKVHQAIREFLHKLDPPPASSLAQTFGAAARPMSTGFGPPFSLSGWTIDNNALSVDGSYNDTGVYIAFLEIFEDAGPNQRQKLKIVAGFKSVSRSATKAGFDIALPSFPGTLFPRRLQAARLERLRPGQTRCKFPAVRATNGSLLS